MSFKSNLYGLKIYDDDNAHELVAEVNTDGKLGGYLERDYTSTPLGSYGPVFGADDLISESDWIPMMQEQQEKGTTLTALHEFAAVPILDQGPLPYCWMYGLTGATMLTYAVTQPYVPHLSATSCAAKGKNFVKEGGWAGEALEYANKYGWSTVDLWPEHTLDRRLITHEQELDAQRHRPGEYKELPPNKFEYLATNLLLRRPVTLGLSWWGHLVYAIELVLIERGSYGVVIVNSWGSRWENKGKTILRMQKAIAAEQIAIHSVKPCSRPVRRAA